MLLLISLHLNLNAQVADFAVNTSKTDETCNSNGTISLMVSHVTPGALLTNYLYKLPELTVPVAQINSLVFSGLDGGDYKIVSTQSLNGVFKSVENYVTINQEFSILNFSMDHELVSGCTTTATLTVSITAGEGSLYEITSGPIIRPVQASPVFDNLMPGTYSVRVFDVCMNAITKPYTLLFDTELPVLNYSLPIYNTDCLSTIIGGVFEMETQTIAYPLSVTFVVRPNNAPVFSVHAVIDSGDAHQQPITTNVLYSNWESFQYDLTVVDACGRTVSSLRNLVRIKPDLVLSTEVLDCEIYSLGVALNAIIFPIQLEFISTPAGFVPTDYLPTFTNEFSQNSTFKFGDIEQGIPAGTYVLKLTDRCGNSITKTIDVPIADEEQEEPIANLSGRATSCLSNVGTITGRITTRKISQAYIIAAPAAYQEVLPKDVSVFINEEGVLRVQNLPLGLYELKLVSHCDEAFEKEVTIEGAEAQNITFSSTIGCDLQNGSITISSPNGKLVQVTLLAAPNNFQQSLPHDYTSGISNAGTFSLSNLPFGVYTFFAVDQCGKQQNLNVEFTVPEDLATLEYTAYCQSFSFKIIDEPDNTIVNRYWFQIWDDENNRWMHPDTNVPYIEGNTIDANTAIALVPMQLYNNFFNVGKYRVMKVYQPAQGREYCTNLVGEFTYTGEFNLLGLYNMNCEGGNGPRDIVIYSEGVGPFTYKITTKDNLPFLVDNGTNNVFTNLEMGVYTFQLEDGCGSIITRTFDLNSSVPLAVANRPSNMFQCVDDLATVALFDFNEVRAQIIGNQDPNFYEISYFESLQDANQNTNALAANYALTDVSKIVYIRVNHTILDDCYSVNSFEILKVLQPKVDGVQIVGICEDQSIRLVAPEGYDAYLWNTGAETREITVSEPGMYEVEIVTTIDGNSCSAIQQYNVAESGKPVLEDVYVYDLSSSNDYVEIIASGDGDYEYSLDDFYYQDSGVFNHVRAGEYTVYVRDKNGCGQVTKDIIVITYPRFFSPNNDSFNDFWHLSLAQKFPDLKIFIFDRFGKLLKNLNYNDQGWDGMINDQVLPATDYWFKLYKSNEQIYHGHFSLIR